MNLSSSLSLSEVVCGVIWARGDPFLCELVPETDGVRDDAQFVCPQVDLITAL
jgi:hypothetical protein